MKTRPELISDATFLLGDPPGIYLAAYFDRRAEIAAYGLILQGMGYKITSRWLYDDSHTNPMPRESDADFRHRVAATDVEDILRATCILSFTESEATWRGGRHVEFGIAWRDGLRCVIVGPRENVFHHLAEVEQFDTWEEAAAMFQREASEVAPL